MLETEKSEKQNVYDGPSDEALEYARKLFSHMQELKRLYQQQISQQNKQPEQDGSGME